MDGLAPVGMAESSVDFEGPHILFEDVDDDGFLMKFGGWEEVIEDGYSSFEAIRKTFQTSDDVIPDLMVPEEEEPEEDRDYITMHNPPQQLIDDVDWQILIVGRLYNYLAEVGLYQLTEEEREREEQLLEEGRHKILLIRQSAFFEDYLVVLCQIRFQQFARRVLSNSEMKMISQMGHEDRARLAYLMGAITETQHGYLQQMISARNDLAHNSWTDHSEEDEQRYQTVSEKAFGVIEEYLSTPSDEDPELPTIDLDVLESDTDD